MKVNIIIVLVYLCNSVPPYRKPPGASIRLEVPRQVPYENLKLGYYYILGITEIINSITSDDDTYSDVDVSSVSTKSSLSYENS